MSIRATAVITSANAGWYTAFLTHLPSILVRGVSLKNTTMTIGQTVLVIQAGVWDTPVTEFGFTELPIDVNELQFGIKGVVQINPSIFDTISRIAPANVSAAYIAKVIGKSRHLYAPATVLSYAGAFLRVQYDFMPDKGSFLCTVAAGLNLTDFKPGHRVLVQHGFSTVLGWWQTVPTISEIPYYFAGNVKVGSSTLFRVYNIGDFTTPLYESSNIEAQKYLVPIGDNKFHLLWHEEDDDEGTPISKFTLKDFDDNELSDPRQWAVAFARQRRLNSKPFVANFNGFQSPTYDDARVVHGFQRFNDEEYNIEYVTIRSEAQNWVIRIDGSLVSDPQPIFGLVNSDNNPTVEFVPYKEGVSYNNGDIDGNSLVPFDVPEGYFYIGVGSSRTDRFFIKKEETYCEISHNDILYKYDYAWSDLSDGTLTMQPASHIAWQHIVIPTHNSGSSEMVFLLFDKIAKTFSIANTVDSAFLLYASKNVETFSECHISAGELSGWSKIAIF